MSSRSIPSAAFRRRAAIASVLLAMAAAVLDASSVNIALPSIAGALRVEPSDVAWLIIAYQGALAACLLPLAAIGERFGYRPTFVAGAGLFALCAAGSSLAPDFPSLIAFRVVQGAGAAAIMALGVALLRQTVAEKDFGLAISWNAMTVALCSAAGPMIGASLLGLGSWRFVFASGVLLTGIALLAASSLPSQRGVSKEIDSVGLLAYAGIVPGFIIAVGLARQSAPAAVILLASGGTGLWLLFRRDARRHTPFLPLALFQSLSFTWSVLASALCFVAMSVALLMLPFALQDRLGLAAGDIALIITPWPVAVLLTTPITTRLLERVRPTRLCAAGALVLACGCAMLAAAPLTWGMAMHILGVILCGIGFGLFQTPNNRTLFLSVPIDRAASAGGVQGTARLAGQVTGALTASILLSAVSMKMAAPLAFGIAALAALASTAISWSNDL